MRKSIFITGAGQGIGLATARLFAKKGWFIGACDVQREGIDRLQSELGPARCYAGVLDVRDPAQWQTALAAFWEAAGQRLDVLLNNAGIARAGAFQDIPLARHHDIVDVNLKGTLNGCHAAFTYLQRTPEPCLINLSSASAIYGAADLASYSATKFAVRGLTEALDLEWRPLGIRVCDVWPLFVRTPMIEHLHLESLHTLGAQLAPEDVAATIWKAAQHRGHRVHWLVGAQTHAMYRAVSLLPDRLNRLVTAKISGRG